MNAFFLRSWESASSSIEPLPSFDIILRQLAQIVACAKPWACDTSGIWSLIQEYYNVRDGEMTIAGNTPQEVLDDQEKELATIQEQLIVYYQKLQDKGVFLPKNSISTNILDTKEFCSPQVVQTFRDRILLPLR